MKKIALFALFSLTGCIDIVHYISFNDRGQTVSSVQMNLDSTLLESGSEWEELKEKFSSITNSTFSKKIEDANIKETNFIVSNSVAYGIQSRMSAPKHYFAASNQNFFPVKESYGFSLILGDDFKKSAGMQEMAKEMDSEAEAIASVLIKYHILLSKADLPRPLVKIVLALPEGQGADIPFDDYGTMYMITIPFNKIVGESQKLEFHFAPK